MGKADVYELVAAKSRASPKRVYFSRSDRTAHVLLPSRDDAIVLYTCLATSTKPSSVVVDEEQEEGGLKERMGPEAKASLVQV